MDINQGMVDEVVEDDDVKVVEEKGKKSTFAKGFVTVDFTCLSCHQSRDRKWASKQAKKVHKK